MAEKTAELAVAVPQVIAHRMARMALAGAMPTPRDQEEFRRMFEEKHQAFSQAWLAMTLQSAVVSQVWITAVARALSAPRLDGHVNDLMRAHQRLQSDTLGVLNKGLAPVHRKAVANARRLARTPVR